METQELKSSFLRCDQALKCQVQYAGRHTQCPAVRYPRQPFSANHTDRLGVSISLGIGPHTMKLTFLSWGGGTFSVVTEARGNLLLGLGPSLGNSSSALYVASFSEEAPGPR